MAVRLVEGATLRRLSRAREFIEAKHAEAITLEAMAESAGLSPFHFLRLFRDVFEETPHRYLTRVRLARAKALLARGASVTEACFGVGFSSVGSFSSLFAREVACSPSAYRRALRYAAPVPDDLATLVIPCCFLARFAGRGATFEKTRGPGLTT
ncbi:MAG TPA: AraC family transcriptional regulator [Polyangiaceae bacterium]|nr:AraC family transcriptional regulator [Polyangiaceae bacterium]